MGSGVVMLGFFMLWLWGRFRGWGRWYWGGGGGCCKSLNWMYFVVVCTGLWC